MEEGVGGGDVKTHFVLYLTYEIFEKSFKERTAGDYDTDEGQSYCDGARAR